VLGVVEVAVPVRDDLVEPLHADLELRDTVRADDAAIRDIGADVVHQLRDAVFEDDLRRPVEATRDLLRDLGLSQVAISLAGCIE
jgi:hypothetical protein